MFAVKPSLLCLLTAHDTAGSGKIGVAKVKEHREVSRLIPWSKAKRRIVKLVAAMRINTPFIWALGHDEETSALTMLLIQRTESPQTRMTRC